MEHSLIYSVGTQVVARKEVMAANDRIAHPAGAVGVIVRSPVDRTHAYRVKFSDGFEARSTTINSFGWRSSSPTASALMIRR